MTEIEVPDWVVEAALLASFRVACEHTGTEFSEDEFRNARDEHDRENRNVASDMMRAALTAALGAWVVPTACTEPWRIDYLSSYPRNTVEVSSMDTLSAGDITLFTLRQEKPE